MGETPPMGTFYQVDGRNLVLYREGTGGPPVVFLPGATLVGLDYLNVHTRVREFTTSVLYDRGGTGWSERTELPRTATEVTTELRNLLRAAEIPGPYILAAHSLGGVYARRFSQMFPDEVAGLLWLDAMHEDWDKYMPEPLRLAAHSVNDDASVPQMTPEQVRSLQGVFVERLAEWPEEIRKLLVDSHLSDEWMRIGARERGNLASLADELRGKGPIPDVPLIALTALAADPGQDHFISADLGRELRDRKTELYDAIAKSVSHGENRLLDDATHSTITMDRPDAVVDAIRDLVGWARA
jgi:pimeloyl-ACP methyl ester carboxylesterase